MNFILDITIIILTIAHILLICFIFYLCIGFMRRIDWDSSPDYPDTEQDLTTYLNWTDDLREHGAISS